MIINGALGEINISDEVIASIAGSIAVGCFGVKGMALKNMADGIVRLLKRDHMSKGVCVYEREAGLADIELHIAVNNGVNIPAICTSIINEVKYHVERLTGIHVGNVDVCIDAIKAN